MRRNDPPPDMSGRAGSECPECGGRLRSEDGGMTYRCRDCDTEFDSADVFLL
jgi:tRNA(Ile2) C34 agmatinyltransferase TiaS